MTALRPNPLDLKLMSFVFQREHCKPVVDPGERKLALELSRVKQSFASLTGSDGQYIQVAGGPGLFLLERRMANGRHFRAFQEKPVAPHQDGTILQFSSGSVSMEQRDWFLRPQVIEVFAAYSSGREWPSYVQWSQLNAAFLR